MKIRREQNDYKDLLKDMAIDCGKCSGLCCTALFFSKLDGFPEDKEAGKPCKNLCSDFSCAIHSKLAEKKMKGCLSYDCFGAGQKVTHVIYSGKNWKDTPETADMFFAVFLLVYQLQQMLWYLVDASSVNSTDNFRDEIDRLICINRKLTELCPEELLAYNIEAYRTKVNKVLKEAADLVSVCFPNKWKRSENVLFGRNLKNKNLDGTDFSMTLLIASNLRGCSLRGTNFLGADLRDTDLRNADLRESIFLTQGQINSAKGNKQTKLPETLVRPSSWIR